ncbi:MAG TPA: hypothetical protein VIG24_10070, partial [Acidimicrobiia bacterium]
MIGVAPLSFDVLGALLIRGGADGIDISAVRRRVVRVPTLDGGAAVNDFGHSAADRAFNISWQPASEAEYRGVERLVMTYSLLTATTRDGAFIVVPESIEQSDGVAQLTLLPLRYA